MGAGRTFVRLLFDHRVGNIAGAVYGTILVTSVIAAASGEEGLPLWTMSLTVIVTVVVFWLAHVYSQALAHSVSTGIRITGSELRGLAVHEWPLLQSAILPLLFVVLGAAGLFERATALWLAVGSGVASLVVWGFIYARREGLGPGGTLASVSVNAAFGLAVVALKAAVSH